MARKKYQAKDPGAGRVQVTAPLPFDYVLRPARGEPRELIVLLHGYAESGKRLLDKLASALPDDAVVLAPNGPFPIPHKSERGWTVVYTWYLYDPGPQEYFIDMSVAVAFLEQGVRALGLSALPKRVIGFSQGGYLAPFAAKALGGVSQVIGIGCEYLVDEWPQGLDFRIDGIHGERDEINTLEQARGSFERISPLRLAGEFHVAAGSGHKVDAAVVALTKTLLEKTPKL